MRPSKSGWLVFGVLALVALGVVLLVTVLRPTEDLRVRPDRVAAGSSTGREENAPPPPASMNDRSAELREREEAEAGTRDGAGEGAEPVPAARALTDSEWSEVRELLLGAEHAARAASEASAGRADHKAYEAALRALLPYRSAILGDTACRGRLLRLISDSSVTLRRTGDAWLELLERSGRPEAAEAIRSRLWGERGTYYARDAAKMLGPRLTSARAAELQAKIAGTESELALARLLLTAPKEVFAERSDGVRDIIKKHLRAGSESGGYRKALSCAVRLGVIAYDAELREILRTEQGKSLDSWSAKMVGLAVRNLEKTRAARR
jgi:hypothetical protein